MLPGVRGASISGTSMDSIYTLGDSLLAIISILRTKDGKLPKLPIFTNFTGYLWLIIRFVI